MFAAKNRIFILENDHKLLIYSCIFQWMGNKTPTYCHFCHANAKWYKTFIWSIIKLSSHSQYGLWYLSIGIIIDFKHHNIYIHTNGITHREQSYMQPYIFHTYASIWAWKINFPISIHFWVILIYLSIYSPCLYHWFDDINKDKQQTDNEWFTCRIA